MKLSSFLNKFYTHSNHASNAARQLSFAGIAIAWIFRQSNGEKNVLAISLIWAMTLFAFSLLLDLLQYFVSSIIWGCFHRKYEDQGKPPDFEIKAPSKLNKFGYGCYYTKIISVLAGYVFVITFLLSTLVKQN